MDTPEAHHDSAPTPEEVIAARQKKMAALLNDHDSFGPLIGHDSYTKKMRADDSIEEERLMVISGGDSLEITRRQHWGEELLVPSYVEVIATTADMLGQSRAELMVEQTLAPEGEPARTKVVLAEYRDSTAPDKSHLGGAITREGVEMAAMTIDMTAEELKRKRTGLSQGD